MLLLITLCPVTIYHPVFLIMDPSVFLIMDPLMIGHTVTSLQSEVKRLDWVSGLVVKFSVWARENFWSRKISGPNKFWVSNVFRSDKIWGLKNVWSENMLGSNLFELTQIWGPKIFRSSIFLGPK